MFRTTWVWLNTEENVIFGWIHILLLCTFLSTQLKLNAKKKPTILTADEKRTCPYWSLFFSSLVMRTKLELVRGESLACGEETHRWIDDSEKLSHSSNTNNTHTPDSMVSFMTISDQSMTDLKTLASSSPAHFSNASNRHDTLSATTDSNCASWISSWLI